MYVYYITQSLILIPSPATILNSHINSFCPLDTTLVLTSANFHSIFPPYHPLLPVHCPPWWLLFETVTWRHLYCIFTHIYSLLIEKDICYCRNVSVKLPCVYLCLSSGDVFTFSGKSFLILFLFLNKHKK